MDSLRFIWIYGTSKGQHFVISVIFQSMVFEITVTDAVYCMWFSKLTVSICISHMTNLTHVQLAKWNWSKVSVKIDRYNVHNVHLNDALPIAVMECVCANIKLSLFALISVMPISWVHLCLALHSYLYVALRNISTYKKCTTMFQYVP